MKHLLKLAFIFFVASNVNSKSIKMTCNDMSSQAINVELLNLYLNSDTVVELGKPLEQFGEEQTVLRFWKGELGKTTFKGQGKHVGLLFFKGSNAAFTWTALGEPCKFNFLESVVQLFGEGVIPSEENIEKSELIIEPSFMFDSLITLIFILILLWAFFNLHLLTSTGNRRRNRSASDCGKR